MCIVDASKLKFIFFVFNVCCCDLQVQNHFFFMCMCVVVDFQVEIHFLKVKLMVYYLKIDRLLRWR